MNTNRLWYKNAVFYELYVRAFYDSNNDGHGDLQGVIQKLDYLKDLGVDCIWLLPIYPSPLKDDGYDISDFNGIHPDYGTLDDFKELVNQAHKRGLKIIADLVLNHTSDQHPWFQASRSDPSSPYRDYYVWSDTPDKYKEARIIFLDTETSNWTWDNVAGQYFWHRFYSSQPDLNYDNPAVRLEMIKVMKYWLDLGIDGFRADAVPYLIEREGTNCENLPETHAYLKELRSFLDQHYPDCILLCEANQWPADVRPYFGDGDEFHMGFHFPVMPRIYMAMRKEDRKSLVWILNQTPTIPDDCQWCIFLRNHDELTLEMVTEQERQWMWQEYAPEARMRLNLGIRRRLAPLLDNDRRKIELANSLLFTLPGAPIIYYGDEIGMGDNIWLPDRNGVRTPMQWDSSPNAGFSSVDKTQLFNPLIADPHYKPERVNAASQRTDSQSLWNRIRTFIRLRQENPVLGTGSFEWLNSANLAVVAYWRWNSDTVILVVNNLSSSNQEFQFPNKFQTTSTGIDLLTNEPIGKLSGFTLQPFAYHWLRFPTTEFSAFRELEGSL